MNPLIHFFHVDRIDDAFNQEAGIRKKPPGRTEVVPGHGSGLAFGRNSPRTLNKEIIFGDSIFAGDRPGHNEFDGRGERPGDFDTDLELSRRTVVKRQ